MMNSVLSKVARALGFPAGNPASPPAGRIWGWVFLAVSLALSVWFLMRAVPLMITQASVFPYDGVIDWGGAREMWAGRDPYSVEGLRSFGLTPQSGLGHPPTALIWFFPFAHLDVMAMKRAFTVVTLMMLLCHVALVARELRITLWPFAALLAFSAVYQTDWFLLHLSQVDLSELIAFLYVLCWIALRRGREITAGVMAGMACTLKLYPGLMVVFLLTARKWRAAAAAVLTYLLFAAEATRRLGPGCFRSFLEQTRSYTDAYMANIRNASIEGVVHRWFYPPWKSFPLGRPVLLEAVLLTLAISLIVLALAWTVSASRIRQSRSQPHAIDLPFALFSILSMAPGPYQWEHYNVTLILPFFLILSGALRGERTREWWMRLGITSGGLLAVALMLNVNLSARRYWESGRDTPDAVASALFYDVTTWLPWFALALMLGVRLFQGRRRAEERPGRSQDVAAP